MESSFLRVVRSNDSNKLQEYFRNYIPDKRELTSHINSPQTFTDIRNFLEQYDYLIKMNLTDFLSEDYYSKGINNFMVMAARGYLPLLKQKYLSAQKDLQKTIINSKTVEGKTALSYALYDQNNYDTITFLVENGAEVDEDSLEKIREYARNNLLDDDISNYYNELYQQYAINQQYATATETRFDDLPPELASEIMLNANPEDLYSLSTSSKLFSDIFASTAFNKQYVSRNLDKLRRLLLTKDPVKANQLCGKKLYLDVCSDPEFRKIYYDKWRSEFADDGYKSNRDGRDIDWKINVMPVLTNGTVMVSFYDEAPVKEGEEGYKEYQKYEFRRIDLTQKELNSLVFPDSIMVSFDEINYPINSDTIFGITLRYFFEQLYIQYYREVTDNADAMEIPEKWPEHYDDHVFFEGFNKQIDPSTGEEYYYISLGS